MMTKEIALQAKACCSSLRRLSAESRNKAIRQIANSLDSNVAKIIAANKKDLDSAKNLSGALRDRLELNEERIQGMIQSLKDIAEQEEVLGRSLSEFTRTDGLKVIRERVPIGVILMIFESRPNVVTDCAGLAIKSGNAIILKGGKEAKYSNEILGQIVREAIAELMPEDTVQVLASDQKEQINDLIACKDEIDVVIPRGGEELIRYIYDNSKIPVIAHFKGLCHVYLDCDADLKKALSISINAKTQRTGVCNAMETLLVHRSLPDDFLRELVEAFLEKGTRIYADEYLYNKYSDLSIELAQDSNWETEYLDNILSLKSVTSVEDAVAHINTYGSNHTEAIVTESEETAKFFFSSIDASCILQNASTRFNDGGELGLGAELGIATTKLHAYGPMGAAEMTTTRFKVLGDGHIRV